MKGRKISGEWLEKLSKTWFKKKSTPWNKGKELSEKTKKKISKSLKGGKWVTREYRNKMKKITTEMWKNEEHREKFIRGMKKATSLTPNRLEKQMIGIMNKNNFPFIFVGNGNFWIRGKKNSFNPDFLHKDKNQKKIIEVFGDYWHNREDHKKRDIQRIKTYKEKGFSVLIIWEKQIKESLEEVIKQIEIFLKNGIQE